MKGVIVKGIGSFYTVMEHESHRQYVLRAQKKLRRQGLAPLVGDEVIFTPGEGEEDGWIEEIEPRRSSLIRPCVANVDLLIVVVAPVPQPDLLMVDRLLLNASNCGIHAVLCANKTDLSPELYEALVRDYTESGIAVLGVSAHTGVGVEALRQAMRGHISCFAGQSAVGKSSLLNALFGLELETGGLSRKTERGRHTTRRCELLAHDDMYVLDTPGFSLLELPEDIEPEAVADAYKAYASLSAGCRFQPCLHDREPGCAVKAEIDAGHMSADRWQRYRELLAEAREIRKGRYS